MECRCRAGAVCAAIYMVMWPIESASRICFRSPLTSAPSRCQQIVADAGVITCKPLESLFCLFLPLLNCFGPAAVEPV